MPYNYSSVFFISKSDSFSVRSTSDSFTLATTCSKSKWCEPRNLGRGGSWGQKYEWCRLYLPQQRVLLYKAEQSCHTHHCLPKTSNPHDKSSCIDIGLYHVLIQEYQDLCTVDVSVSSLRPSLVSQIVVVVDPVVIKIDGHNSWCGRPDTLFWLESIYSTVILLPVAV